jgi:GNAT superfamily N-acetyltransferase
MAAVGPEIRDFREADAAQLLELMRELASFEGYIDDFRVTEAELVRRAFGPSPEFFALVAEAAPCRLAGMAVGYVTAFTYTLQPAVTLKEFFVRPESRSQRLGRRLFAAFVERALALGAGSLRWTVLADNERAKAFYREFGATHDAKWEPWTMDAAAMRRLAPQRG